MMLLGGMEDFALGRQVVLIYAGPGDPSGMGDSGLGEFRWGLESMGILQH